MKSVTRFSLIHVFGHSVRAWWEDDALRLGASLSFYQLLAIAPVLLVSIAIAGLVFGAEAVRGELVGQMDDLVGREGAQAVQALLEGASKRQIRRLRDHRRHDHAAVGGNRRVSGTPSRVQRHLAG